MLPLCPLSLFCGNTDFAGVVLTLGGAKLEYKPLILGPCIGVLYYKYVHSN